MDLIRGLNLGLRLLLEFVALAALGYAGYRLPGHPALRMAAAIGAPLAMAALWGTFISPKAPARLDDPLRLALELLIFAAAAGGLLVAGRPAWAGSLAGAVVVSEGLMLLLDQRGA